MAAESKDTILFSGVLGSAGTTTVHQHDAMKALSGVYSIIATLRTMARR